MSTRFSILAAAVASLAFAHGASAAPITISFSTPSIDLTGGAVTDDITISGLTAAGQEVTSYDLFVDFNASELSASNVTFGALPDDLGGFSSVDNVDGMVELNDFGLGPDADYSVEGDSFMLGSITFTPLGGGSGTSSPTFDLADSQVTGLTDPSCSGPNPPEPQCPFPVLLRLTTSGGGGGTTVPEPATLGLLGLGLGALGFAVTRRRRRGAA